MKTTTVYRGPGYPVDPKKEEKRTLQSDPNYLCIMLPPRPRRNIRFTIEQINQMIFDRLRFEQKQLKP